MKPMLLVAMSSWILICGCAGRMDADLLQARIREQESQLTQSASEMAKTRSELKQARIEAEKLRSELAEIGIVPDSVDHAPILASRLRIHSLSSGGLNKDDRPGDDVVVIQFVPLDADNEVLRVAGAVEFWLFDPQLPESDRELGHWTFSADECGRHWTRGIASSGFQFSLPLDQDPQHSDLIVKLTFQTPAGRNLELSQVVKVVSGLGTATKTRRVRMVPVHTVEESNDFLPPVGDSLETSDLSRDDLSNNVDGPAADSLPAASRSGHAVLHSSNWTDSTIPTIR